MITSRVGGWMDVARGWEIGIAAYGTVVGMMIVVLHRTCDFCTVGLIVRWLIVQGQIEGWMDGWVDGWIRYVNA